METQERRPQLGAPERRDEDRSPSLKRRFAIFAALAAAVAMAACGTSGPPKDRTPGTGTETPSGLYSFDLTTGATTPLSDALPEASLYAVSPDGTMIAGASCCGSPNPVWVANIDGTDLRQITPEGIDGFAPRWSPDGSMVVYQEREASGLEIGNVVVVYVATLERSTITDLPTKSYGGWSIHPSFTSDGRSVLFHMPRGPSGGVDPVRWDVVSVPVTGGESTVLRRGATFGASAPSDGSLVYVDPSSWTIFVADADGRHPRILVEVGEEIGRPVWSPTGSEVAYADPSGVHVVDVATGDVSLATDGDPVDWSW
jgi:Tol biopolymer transport system component